MRRRFSPHGKISAVPLSQVQVVLIGIFMRHGLPDHIKVDNGRPFGDPQRLCVPPLALWLLGLGIGMIWNRPRVPQDNAKVERAQGVLQQWSEPQQFATYQALQERLAAEVHFQRACFAVSRLGERTRLEAFPHLAQMRRPYQAEDWQLRRVLDFLEKGNWVRSVNKVGQISHFGQRYSIGQRYRYQQVSIRLNAATNQWQVLDDQDQTIRTFNTQLSAQSIWNLNSS